MENPDDINELVDRALNGTYGEEKTAAASDSLAMSDAQIARQELAEEVSDDDDDLKISFKRVVGGSLLGSKWFRRQVPFVFFIVVLMIIYVYNGYAYEKQINERDALQKKLVDCRYKALTMTSELKYVMRPSYIEAHVSDTALQRPYQPVYSIKVEKK